MADKSKIQKTDRGKSSKKPLGSGQCVHCCHISKTQEEVLEHMRTHVGSQRAVYVVCPRCKGNIGRIAFVFNKKNNTFDCTCICGEQWTQTVESLGVETDD